MRSKLAASGVVKYVGKHSVDSPYKLKYPYEVDMYKDHTDWLFAAPELLFQKPESISQEEWQFKQDNYMLGGLIVYYITGVSFNTLMSNFLPLDIATFVATKNQYSEAIPDLLYAYEHALSVFEDSISIISLKKDLRNIVGYLCHPDYSKRRNPVISVQSRESSFNIDRTREHLDLLRRRVEIELYKVKK